MIRSTPSLKRIYRRYNARYFGGKLPDDTIIYWGPHPRRDGCCWKDGAWHIEIDPSCNISDRFVHIVLLHEMMHIQLPAAVKHGKAFSDECRRLVALGAYDRWL